MSSNQEWTAQHIAIPAWLIHRILALIAAYAMISVTAPAQVAGPRTELPSGSTAASASSHVNIDDVSIDLVVRDKKKKPVTGLTPADIAVSDAGTPVQLSALHLVTAQTGGFATIALLFDNISPESARVARDMADRLLVMAPDQTSFAVLGLDRGLRLLQNFTSDRAALRSATSIAMTDLPPKDLTDAEKQLVSIIQTGTLPSGASAGIEERARAKMMLSALEESQQTVKDQHALPALAGLQALAKAQQNVAGRKIIIFFSEGLRTNSKTDATAHEVVQDANRAGVSIYAVDTNAVDTKSFDLLTMMYQPGRSPTFRSSPGVAGITPGPNMARIGTMEGNVQDAPSVGSIQEDRHDVESGLSLLARSTGGFLIRGGENLREPLQRLVGDIDTYYEATYTPVLKDYDGQFHSIEINPLREGVTVRSSAGYFALPPEAAGPFSMRPFEAPMLKVLTAPELPTQVPFQQAVVRLGGTASRTANEIAIQVPFSGVELREDDNTLLYSAHVSFLAQIRDKSGTVIERFSQDVNRSGALEAIDAARASSVTLQRHFNAAPGDYVLESAVLDHLGSKAGAQRMEFNIPEPPAGPWLSDITLVQRTEPMGSTPDPLEPMQYGKLRVVPDIEQQVAAGSQHISFFFRSHTDPSLAAKDATLELDVQRDGKILSHASIAVAHSTASDSSVNFATIDAKDFTPGAYRAVFVFTQGDKIASRDLAFTVDGTTKPGDDADSDTADAATDLPANSSVAGTDIPGLPEYAPGRFIAASPGSASHPPSAILQSSLLSSARDRALGYLDSLANFKCIEVTDRFVDRKGTGTWTRHDKIAEMLTFDNHEESRKVLEINGQPGATLSYDMKNARLEGEFGGVLKIVFDPASKADFQWRETVALDDAPVEVFHYQVEAKNSKFSVTALPDSPVMVAFHGLVYIDAATRGVRRITIEAEDIPSGSPVHASAIVIDYDYVAINNHDYLMPVGGEMRMKVGRLEAILHRIEFRDYHRFGSDSRIVGFTPK